MDILTVFKNVHTRFATDNMVCPCKTFFTEVAHVHVLKIQLTAAENVNHKIWVALETKTIT